MLQVVLAQESEKIFDCDAMWINRDTQPCGFKNRIIWISEWNRVYWSKCDWQWLWWCYRGGGWYMLGSRSQHTLSEKNIMEFDFLDPVVLVDYIKAFKICASATGIPGPQSQLLNCFTSQRRSLNFLKFSDRLKKVFLFLVLVLFCSHRILC